MRINHNIAALNTYRQLSNNNAIGAKSLEKLSSGLRINRAGDDAAGLAISEKMRGQIRGLDQAARNAQDGISMIQTAEGALNEVHSILQRMRELAVQAANDTNTDDDRAELQKEIQQLKQEIDRIGNTTEFNTQKLLNGTKGVSTTSADLTAGVAKQVSALNPISIVDGKETQNNQIVVVYNDGTSDYYLTLNIAEGQYNDLVSFTNAFNNALDKAAADLKTLSGTDITADIANFRLKFDVTTGGADDGKVTFQLVASAATSNTLTVKFNAAIGDALKKALNITGDVDVTGDGSNIVTNNFNGFSQDVSGTAFQWNEFSVKLEDGLNPTANQNNILKMTYDGLSVTSYIAEGTYKTEADLETAVKNAIVGVDTSDAAYTNIISTPSAASWDTLITAAKTYGLANNAGVDDATGLIKAIDSMTDEQLNAKGYNGNTKDMKAAYFKDLVIKGGETLTVDFNSDHKLTISGPAEMQVDETSKAAVELGLTDVNIDISQKGITLHIGANAAQTMIVGINDMRTTAIGTTAIEGKGTLLLKDIDVSSKVGAQEAMQVLDTAIKEVSAERSKLGAIQNRLEHTINNLGTASENLSSAESRIRDVDMAKEMMEFTKMSILSQAAQAMLAQANQQPQGVLQLLR